MVRGLSCCLVALALGTAAGCATTPATPAPASSAGVGVTPPAALNPSDPPYGAPIATGVRSGDAMLLLWFNRLVTPVGLDTGWYDPRTGAPADGPQPSMAWLPRDRSPACFQLIQELPMPEGDLLDLGFLIAPAASVLMAERGVTARAGIAPWSRDPGVVAFWIRRQGRPVGHLDTAATRDTPEFTALDGHGTTLCRQAFISPYLPNRDG
jgi:hypothetical protein